MKTVNQYQLMLKSGVSLMVTRNEEPNKTAIGLWKWSQKQMSAVIIDFNECSVDLAQVAIIYNAEMLHSYEEEAEVAAMRFEHEPAEEEKHGEPERDLDRNYEKY